MTPEERLDRLVNGNEPKLVARMASGFAVMADVQFLPGYCLLLAYPQVGQLNELTGEDRAQFLHDMARLGDAVQAATEAVRINYSIYGNLDPFLHAHVFPRFLDEDDRYRTVPPFLYPPELREDPEARFDPKVHGLLRDKIQRYLLDELLIPESFTPR
jgi:diadenosine tetraphosphate (Ap4A) HIT family hydrolase